MKKLLVSDILMIIHEQIPEEKKWDEWINTKVREITLQDDSIRRNKIRSYSTRHRAN